MTAAGEALAAQQTAASTDRWPRRAARAVLRRAVRGSAARGTDWGEAMLAEFEETDGWESVRWSMSGALASWRQRRGGRSLLASGVATLIPRRRTARILVVAVLAVALTAAFFRFVVSFAYIPSGSMEPTLLIGDRLLVDRVGFRVSGLKRGDIVLHTQEGHQFVKRIVGMAGDTIDCADGRLRRNGQPVGEAYLPAGTVTQCSAVTVPAGSLYLLGDHRAVSVDSRQNGPVDEDAIDGRLLFRAWPVTRS